MIKILLNITSRQFIYYLTKILVSLKFQKLSIIGFTILLYNISFGMNRHIAKRIGLHFNIIFNQSYLLKNGTVVNADLSELNDVIIEDGIITAVGKNISAKNAKIIDCAGKMIIPGGIDTHTHMQLPFMGTYAIDDFDSGTKAAISGGTTSHIDFAIPSHTETLTQAYQTWREWADPKVNCDYALHSAITSWNQGTKDHMRRMVENGIQSFKFFMAYNNVLRLDDVSMYMAFEYAAQLGAICIVHAQNGDIIQANQEKLLKKGITGPEGHYLSRPPSVQAQATHRVITIAQHANCPVYIVHLMSRQSAEQVMRAKNKGQIVFGETLAATLGTDGRKLWDKDWNVASRYVMSPCLNPDPTVKTQIMKYLNSGVIDVVGTDNCTFCTDQKQLGRQTFTKIPNGVNGLEDRLAIVWTKGVLTGLISENQFVEVTSTKAARIFNMYPNKGVIRQGADADVVVWDPKHRKIISAKHHHQKVDYNVFEGMEVFGKACYTFSRGNLVWDGEKFHNQHKGKYIKRNPFGYAFARHKMYTEANDPLKLKVDRQSSTHTIESEQSEILKLQQELRKTREQRDKLLNEVKNRK